MYSSMFICDRVRENQPYVGKNISTDIGKVPPMDLRCKFGVDCLLPARDIATFICAMLIPKTAISRNYVIEMFPYIRGPLHVRVHRVAFSRGRRAFKLSTCR